MKIKKIAKDKVRRKMPKNKLILLKNKIEKSHFDKEIKEILFEILEIKQR